MTTTEGSIIDEDDWHAPPTSSSSSYSWETIDSAYEFDASQFFDFSRPESSSDAERAERWFQVAGYYPPSHFYFKAKVKTPIIIIPASDESPMAMPRVKDDLTPSSLSSSSNHEKTTKGGRRRWNNSGQEERIEEEDDSTPSKAIIKPKGVMSAMMKCDDANKNMQRSSGGGGGGSTLMKPTASHLAKLNHVKQQQQQRHKREAIKRQKLDCGYFITKGGGSSSSPVTKAPIRSELHITVPREPHLETQCRAQWRRFKSKNNLSSSICSSDNNVTKEKSSASKARPLNKKIQVFPSTPQIKRSIRQSPTSQKPKVSDEKKKKLLQHPPIELFSKLTLNSDMDNRAASHPKKTHPFGNVNLNKFSAKK